MKTRTVWIVGGIVAALLVVVIVLLVLLMVQLDEQAAHQAYLLCLERLGYSPDEVHADIDGLALAAESCFPD